MADSELATLREARNRPGVVHHKGPGPEASGWLEPRGRALGGRAFALHRITGVALVGYLYLHLCVLSMLLFGNSAWSSFLGVVTSKSFLALEAILIFGLIFHGLNGIRVALVGSGVLVSHQRALFWGGTAIGSTAIVLTALHLFGAL